MSRLTYLQAEASLGNWVKFSLTHTVSHVWSVECTLGGGNQGGDKWCDTEVTTIYNWLSHINGVHYHFPWYAWWDVDNMTWLRAGEMCVAPEILMTSVNVSNEGLTQIKYLRLRIRTKWTRITLVCLTLLCVVLDVCFARWSSQS